VTKTSQVLEVWNCEVAKALASLEDGERLVGAMARMVRALIPSDILDVSTWSRSGQWRELHRDPADFDIPVHPLPDVYYQLDPFHLAYREGRSGSVSLRELAPPGFERSAYYQEYYLAYGYSDALVHIVRPSEDAAIWIESGRMGRTGQGFTGDAGFTRAERELHKAMFPVVEAFSARLACLVWDTGEVASRSDEAELESTFERFGADCLTEREGAVIRLVLRGHNTRSVASELGIAPETVKLHRKHAYAKLHVSSQGELFAQFLQSLEYRASLR